MRKKESKTLIIGQVIILFGILITFVSPSKVESVVHVVEIHKNKFIPKKIAIKLGDSVKFVNKSSHLHNIVIKRLKIQTKYLEKGKSVTVKIPISGKYKYFCFQHKALGMKGKIDVRN